MAHDLVGKAVTLVPMRLDDVRWLAAWLGSGRTKVLARWPPVFFDDAYPRKGRAFRVDVAGEPRGAVVHGAFWGQPASVNVELIPGALGEAEAADAIDALCRFLFESLHARTVWSELAPGDAAALAAFEAAGFRRERSTSEGRLAMQRGSPRPAARDAPTKPK
jgi:hypothetical protein